MGLFQLTVTWPNIYWMEEELTGTSKQKNVKSDLLDSIVFKAVYNLLSSSVAAVPCDNQLQKAYLSGVSPPSLDKAC